MRWTAASSRRGAKCVAARDARGADAADFFSRAQSLSTKPVDKFVDFL